VCDLHFEPLVGDISAAAAGDVMYVIRLTVRMHAQHTEPAAQRCLECSGVRAEVCTRSAISRRCALQGVSSENVLQIPMIGRPSKTWSGKPWLRMWERWTKPSLSSLPNQAADRYFRLSSDIPTFFVKGCAPPQNVQASRSSVRKNSVLLEGAEHLFLDA